MAFSDLHKWSSPSTSNTVTVYGANSLLPYRYSASSITTNLLVYNINSLLPYYYSEPSVTTEIVIENGLGLEFTNAIADFQNTRVLSATVRVYNLDDNTDSIDPDDEYYFSFVPTGEAPAWNLSTTNTWQTPSILDNTVPAGEMQRSYTLKAKVVRSGTQTVEIYSPDKIVVIDEVPPVTTMQQAAGVYSPEPLTVILNVNDFSPTTTYYTVDGSNPTQSSDVYTAAGITLEALDVPIVVKFFSVDAAGNIEEPNWAANENSVEVILDSIPPEVTIDSVSPSLLVVGTVADIVWHVNEYCSNIRLEIGGGGVVGNGVLIHTATNIQPDISQTLQISASVLPSGTSTLYLFATDAAGNIGTGSFQLEFENAIPIVDVFEVYRHTLASNDMAKVVWKTNIGGNYSVRLGGQNPGEGVLLGSGIVAEEQIIESTILSSQLLPNVANEIRIYIETPGGNVGVSSIYMSVDTLPPTTTINVTGDDGPFLSPFGIRIDAYDNIPSEVTIDAASNITQGGFNLQPAQVTPSFGLYPEGQSTGLEQVITPVISPAGGIKTSFFYAIISCATPGATIYMTLDGEEPTTSSAIYGGAFLVDKTLTVKAMATKTGMADSEITTIQYTMVVETVATPTMVSTSNGENSVLVSLACATPGAEIHYTTNGSTPTALSNIYTSPLSFSGSTQVQVKAIAVKTGMYNSAIATEEFLVPIGLGLPSVVDITTNSATILWTTARAANSIVEYGEDPYLDYLIGYLTETDNSFVTEHSVTLPLLEENTTYFYRIKSVDNEGIVAEKSTILSFTTNTTADLIPPTITNLSATVNNSQEVEITWTTDEAASSIVIYGTDAILSNPIELPVQDTAPRVSQHHYIVNGLLPDTQYWFQAKSLDEAGNQTISSEIVSATTWASNTPIISNVTVNAYRTVCVIRWETDLPAMGHIVYGTTTAVDLTAQPLVAGYKTSHEVIITGLTPDRQYYFALSGQDELGRTIVFPIQTFNSAPNRDARIVIYASVDGSTPTVNNYHYRVIGNPLLYTVNSDTVLKYFAVDGFGNQQEIQTEQYAFDVTGPVITVDWMEPVLLNGTMYSSLRFKADEDCHYVVKNHAGTVLATNENDFAMNYSVFGINDINDVSEPASLAFVAGLLPANTWEEVSIFASSLEEGYNHITIYATDKYGNETSLLVGQLLKDTVPPIVEPSIPQGYYNNTQYVSLIPVNLREDEGVTIYYTIDGSLPTYNSSSAEGQVYNILVANTTTIRWFAVDEAGNVSDASYATYVIDKQAPVVYATPAPGEYDEVIDVELRVNEAATIFYTTNETLPSYPPNEYTSIYTKPIQVLHNTTITCFARDLAGNNSEIKTFEYEIKILHDKKFKKVIGFQDKMFLETEFNEAQDNINRRIEEMAKEVIGDIGIVHGFNIVPSNFPGSFEFYLLEGKAYIDGKFVTIMRQDQSFVPSLLEAPGDKTYHVLLLPDEPIFRPSKPGQPGWEEGVPDITTYRLEEGYIIRVTEDYPDAALEPYIELYDVIRPANAGSIADCTIIDKRRFFQPLAGFQNSINDTVSALEANLLALGMEVESYKLRNILGLKNAFVDTFESTKDVDMSKSKGYRYINTRFEL